LECLLSGEAYATFKGITDSNIELPPNGYLLMISHINKVVDNFFLNSGYKVGKSKLAPSDTERFLSMGKELSYSMSKSEDYVCFDIFHALYDPTSLLQLNTCQERTFFHHIKNVFRKTMAIILIIFLISIIVTIVMLDQIVIKKIAVFSKEFLKIGENRAFKKHLPEKGAKEIKDLAKSANIALNEITKLNTSLLEISRTDPLTGISNRRFFDETYEKEWRRMIRSSGLVSIIMIDIDDFKKFNDQHGHQAGDSCLVQVAQTIKESLRRPSDFVARYGGEEFIILLPETDCAGTQKIAEMLLDKIRNTVINLDSEQAQVTISVGTACGKASMFADRIEIIKQADDALYSAKKTKNCCKFYNNKI
jgi:diguanylate cyclase (GGDEF)-like protein